MICVQHIVAFDISVTITLFSSHQELLKNSLRTQLAMAKRANQPTYYFHYWLNLTEMSPKNNSQIIGRCNMHIPMSTTTIESLFDFYIPLWEIDPDINVYNKIDTHLVSSCNYYMDSSFLRPVSKNIDLLQQKDIFRCVISILGA